MKYIIYLAAILLLVSFVNAECNCSLGYQCQNNACVPLTSKCLDSDSGQYPLVGGLVYSATNGVVKVIAVDSCAKSGTQVSEKYCNGIRSRSKAITCTSGTCVPNASTVVINSVKYNLAACKTSCGNSLCDSGETSQSCPADCKCGNNILDPGEQCDDGNNVNGDGCTINCIREYCGDRVVNNVNEQCDDGNNINNDGCSGDCRKEFCTDSDGGNNYPQQGTVVTLYSNSTDYCIDGKNLMEYSCQGTNIASGSYQCAGSCAGGACVFFSQNNVKDMTKYMNNDVFLVSDLDWHTVLPLVPVTTWTGNENCNHGYGTPGNVCTYPTLLYHEAGPISTIHPKEMWYLLFSGGYPYYLTNDSPKITQEYTGGPVSCGSFTSFALGFQTPMSPDVVNVGDTFGFNITILNCNTTSSINIQKISFSFIYLSKYITGGNIIFNGTDGIIASNQTKVIPIEFRFISPFDGGISADSTIFFLQQYKLDRLTTVGKINQSVSNLLVSVPPVGAGLQSSQIRNIAQEDYFSFWQSFDKVVYVQDNYELALLAATYASLINTPLIIQGTSSDTSNVFAGKNVICVGSVSPAGSTCSEIYTLEQLRQKYKQDTATNKIILVNPNDYAQYISTSYYTLKTGTVFDPYRSTSISAPFLAAAKQELILSKNSTDYLAIDNFLKSSVNNLYGTLNTTLFLTIMGAPSAIPYRLQEEPINGYEGYENYRSLDATQYADINHNFMPDWYVGRIQGISSEDASSYVARDLFHNKLYNLIDVKFMATSFDYEINHAKIWSPIFTSSGYNSAYETYIDYHSFDRSSYINKTLDVYMDHGSYNTGATSYGELPVMSNTIAIDDACSTCSALGNEDFRSYIYSPSSYCARMIKNGAMAHYGAVSIAWTGNQVYRNTLNGIYYRNEEIGKAFVKGYISNETYPYPINIYWMTEMLGDPAFNPNPPHRLVQILPFKY